MKTTKQILDESQAKNPSDETVYPKRIAHVEFSRAELLKALEPVKTNNHRARDLYSGVLAVQKGKNVIVQREHLLVALGALPDDEEPDNEPDDGQQSAASGSHI